MQGLNGRMSGRSTSCTMGPHLPHSPVPCAVPPGREKPGTSRSRLPALIIGNELRDRESPSPAPGQSAVPSAGMARRAGFLHEERRRIEGRIRPRSLLCGVADAALGTGPACTSWDSTGVPHKLRPDSQRKPVSSELRRTGRCWLSAGRHHPRHPPPQASLRGPHGALRQRCRPVPGPRRHPFHGPAARLAPRPVKGYRLDGIVRAAGLRDLATGWIWSRGGLAPRPKKRQR